MTPAEVALEDAEQRAEQRGAQQRLLLGQWVGQPHRGPTRVVGRQAELVGQLRRHERVREHLHVPPFGQRPGDGPAATLPRGQTASRRRGRQHRRHPVVPVEADHLLDQVGRVGQVGPPGRRGDAQHRPDAAGHADRARVLGQPVRALRDSAADPLQQGDHPRRRVLDADPPGRQIRRKADRGTGPDVVDVQDLRTRRAPAVLGEQPHGTLQRDQRHGRVDAPLPALRGLAEQLVPAGGAPDHSRVPVRRLEEHRGGAGDDLAGLAAHHRGEGDRDAGALACEGVGQPSVADHHVVGGEHPVDPVEGGQLLPRFGATDHQRPGDPVGVEGVHRLAQLQHHVVGDVDGQRDAADAGGDEPLLHPGRCGRGRVDPADQAGREPVAADRVADLHRVRGRPGAARGRRQGRVAQRHVERVRQLPGQAAQAQRVPPVRGDLQIEDDVVEADHRTRVVARLGRHVRPQHDDAGVVVAQAQFLGRADHARRVVPVRLAGADGEAAGQHAAGQDHHDPVTRGEVTGTADDLLRLAGAVGGTHVDPAEPDRLLEAGELLDLADLTDDQLAGDGLGQVHHGLDLDAEVDQGLLQVTGGQVGGEVDVLPQPTDRNSHDFRPPFPCLVPASPTPRSRARG
ncbi:hypothetical protein PSN01_03942 [Micromonospora saelicesensis]|nr:hypothetical protein PSN01_03942 [Micromonospora saelicesensis]